MAPSDWPSSAANPPELPAAAPAALASDAETEARRKIWRSIACMVAHLDQPLDVATLAAAVNVSPSHYFALFKRFTGCAPIDYFIRLRMWRASQLLDSNTVTVREVAEELGYEDPFYFSRVFKSVHRIPPSQYRSLPERAKEAVRNSKAMAVVSRSAAASGPEQNASLLVAPRAAPAGHKTSTAPSVGGANHRFFRAKNSVLYSQA